MIRYIKKLFNRTKTINGAKTYRTTQSYCLDLFATIGALRHRDQNEILSRFKLAFNEDSLLAVKIAFYARDIRKGLGERNVFRQIIRYIAFERPDIIEKNINLIEEYGRYDDLISLFDTPCEKCALEVIKKVLIKDIYNLNTNQGVSLIAKWLPSINTSNANARINGKKIARYLNMSDKSYRQLLVQLRKKIKIIENNLREKDYTFDYSTQPSMAMLKYRKAFRRNDSDRYLSYLDSVQKGEQKINTSTLTPFDLMRKVLTQKLDKEDEKSLNVMWNNLPNYVDNSNTLVVADTSGSMTANRFTPLSIALSLAIYFAERNKGKFANMFIEFSREPTLIKIKGNNFVEKARCVASYSQVANTNLEAVFDLIVSTAVKYHLKQGEIPDRLLIISDMEFDMCIDNSKVSNFENAKSKYAKFGYELPQVVFWNVNSISRQQPVKQNEQGVILVSGSSPNTFDMVIQGDTDPYEFMLKVINSERYNAITI